MDRKQIAREHLVKCLIPFWSSLRDEENGGYIGYVDADLQRDPKAEKGCILHSRILWFFSSAYALLKTDDLLDNARHAYAFVCRCMDAEFGGIYWSMTYDGQPLDTTKHTYNQAFCIYALSAYYQATGEQAALTQALSLYDLIERRCRDDRGYLEAFTRDFHPASNEKLSENGVEAKRTMNTALHVLESYTALYQASGDLRVGDSLRALLTLFADRIYNPLKRREEVFFDDDYHSLIDLHSYGHDVESSWLIDRALDVLGDADLRARLADMTDAMLEESCRLGFTGDSLYAERENGVDLKTRIWWVQAETVVGLLNYYGKHPDHPQALRDAENTLRFILTKMVDNRPHSEWFWALDDTGVPLADKPIVEPWKCPYHNGRMCMEIMVRT